MEIVLIRHAEPDYENDTITPKGHKQAKALAEHLKSEAVSAIYCSPRGRAQDTMKYTAGKMGIEPVTLDWLAELDGEFEKHKWAWSVPATENLTLEDIPRMDNWHVSSRYGNHMRPVYEKLAQNFDAFLAERGYEKDSLRYRVRQSSDETILIFCHEGLIKTLLSYLFSWPLPLVYSHLSYSPTGVTRLLWNEHNGYTVPRAKTINDLSHL